MRLSDLPSSLRWHGYGTSPIEGMRVEHVEGSVQPMAHGLALARAPAQGRPGRQPEGGPGAGEAGPEARPLIQ